MRRLALPVFVLVLSLAFVASADARTLSTSAAKRAIDRFAGGVSADMDGFTLDDGTVLTVDSYEVGTSPGGCVRLSRRKVGCTWSVQGGSTDSSINWFCVDSAYAGYRGSS